MGNAEEPADDSLDDTSNEQPTHRVFLDTYQIDKYEVTVGQYKECLMSKKCRGREYSDLDKIPLNEPVSDVTWTEAVAYCEWRGKRLPTEAEWEKAARGPNNYTSPWGNRPYQKGDAAIGTHGAAIGSFAGDRSDYGVYDMAGNMQEWTADWYGPYQDGNQNNPAGPKEGTVDGQGPTKVVRGAAFITNLKYDWRSAAFSTRRSNLDPKSRSFYIGFRCAISAKSKEKSGSE